jgi:putative ABC transport system permease protein
MNLPTRWVKVWKDIWGNKTRSLLVILSIAVGVIAVGMTTNGGQIVRLEMNEPYLATHPASTTLYITPFDENLAHAVEDMREISQAEARRIEIAEAWLGANERTDIQLVVVPDFNNIRLNEFTLEAGQISPGPRQMLLERQTADLLGASVGDVVRIEPPGSERWYDLEVIGITHDMHAIPPWALGVTTAYVSMETLAWMGLGSYYNALEILVAENATDKVHIMYTAGLARDRVIEPAGYRVISIEPFLPNVDPGAHYANNDIMGMVLIVNVIGVMCIFLTAGLVINTASALITREVKQIGIIRSIGGLRPQILQMYLSVIVVFSAASLILAIPVGAIGAHRMAGFVGELVNFDVTRIRLPLWVVLLQVGVGLVVPLIAALFPILAGTRISVYDAVYQHGLIRTVKVGAIEGALRRIQGLTSPVVLAIRNTFRRKARLAFTLVTLTLAGATFVGALSTYSSLLAKFDTIVDYWAYDVAVEVPTGANRHTLEREAMRVPGVAVAEGWYRASATFVYPDRTESSEVEVMAIPHDSVTVLPSVTAGRWLEPGDTNVIVINEDVLDTVPDIGIGSSVTLRVNGLDRPYQIVGVVSRHIFGPRIYMPYDHFGKTYHVQGLANLVRARTNPDVIQEAAVQEQFAPRLEERLENAGFAIGDAETQQEMLNSAVSGFQTILAVLTILSVLLAAVGGMGLAGTMSLNVMERTREIGVLRAVGGTNAAVQKIILIEGLVVGLLSWILGVIVSIPFGMGLANAVSVATMQTTLALKFSATGAAIWLVLILGIAALASLIPAQRASQLTVREVLAYE